MASRCTTALVDPPIAASATIALRNDARVEDRGSAGGRPRPSRRPGVPARAWALQQPAVRRRRAGRCRAWSCRAPRRRSAMVEAVPMVLQCPRLRIIDDSDARNALLRQRAGADLLAEPPHVGAAAQRHAPEGAGQHRAAGHDHGRAGRPTPRPSAATGSSCRSRRAAPRPSIGLAAQHLLGSHRRHVPPQHRGRPQVGLADGTTGRSEPDVPPPHRSRRGRRRRPRSCAHCTA